MRIFHGHALWWLFHNRGWPNRFKDVRRRCICEQCKTKNREIIRNPRLELVREEITGIPLCLPPHDVWKRELRRRRWAAPTLG